MEKDNILIQIDELIEKAYEVSDTYGNVDASIAINDSTFVRMYLNLQTKKVSIWKGGPYEVVCDRFNGSAEISNMIKDTDVLHINQIRYYNSNRFTETLIHDLDLHVVIKIKDALNEYNKEV